MINRERDEGTLLHPRKQRLLSRIRDSITEQATELSGRFSHEQQGPKVLYGLPVSGRLGGYLLDAGVVNAIPRIGVVDVPSGIQTLIAKRQDPGVVFDRDSDTVELDGVLFQAEHSRDLARSAVVEVNENVVRLTGLEALVSEVMQRVGTKGDGTVGEFQSIEYRGKRSSLAKKDGSPVLIPSIFDRFLRVLPDESVLWFIGKDRKLKVTVLPTPNGIDIPTVCLLGSKKIKNGNLSNAMVKARANRQRVVVVYKEGDEGILDGFVQGEPGDTNVYDVSPAKNRVMRVNSEPAKQYGLPPVGPGHTQVITIPVTGQIESYINGKKPLPCEIRDVYAVFGLDVVQTGKGMMDAGAVPIEFRKGRMFVPPKWVSDWYHGNESKKRKFHQYIRRTGLMPVHLVAVQTERITVVDRARKRIKEIFDRSKHEALL